MKLVAIARPVLEAMAFIATVLMAVGVLVAWRQLSHIRRDTKIRVLREAQHQAIVAADDYMRGFCEEKCLTAEFLDKYGSYRGAIGDFTCNSLAREQLMVAVKKLKDDEYRIGLNHLESIASKFVSGVADEKTGFEIMGRSYCGVVQDLYDIISACRELTEVVPFWKNIVQLYQWWRPRMESLELESTGERVRDRLHQLGSVAPRNPTGF